MKKIWVILSLVCVLAGCATSEVINPEEYDATKHARIRIFATGDGGSTVRAIVGIDCDTNKKGTPISPDGWFSGCNQHRIGMTQTEETDKAQKNGDKFREYVIPAGKVVNLSPSQQISQTVCRVAGQPCQVGTKQLCEYGPIEGFDPIRKFLTKVISLGATDGGERRNDRASFIPQAGHQYEIKPAGCALFLKDITEEEVKAVNLSSFYQCPVKQ